MPTYDFPQDLRDAQLALHETRARYEQYARTLPWSAAPMPGWESEKQPYTSFRSGKSDSPGYTDEQAAEIAHLKARILELGIFVSTHPFWSSVESGLVDARMALKHVHEQPTEA